MSSTKHSIDVTDDLTERDLVFLKESLEAQRLEAAALLAADAEHSHLAEPDRLASGALSGDARQRADQRLSDISDALDRLAAGVYGVCERCRGAIGGPRLEALPHARCCITCSSQDAGLRSLRE